MEEFGQNLGYDKLIHIKCGSCMSWVTTLLRVRIWITNKNILPNNLTIFSWVRPYKPFQYFSRTILNVESEDNHILHLSIKVAYYYYYYYYFLVTLFFVISTTTTTTTATASTAATAATTAATAATTAATVAATATTAVATTTTTADAAATATTPTTIIIIF